MTDEQKRRVDEQLNQLGFDKHWEVDLYHLVTRENYEELLNTPLCCSAGEKDCMTILRV